MESNYDDIRSEYFNAVLGQGNETNPHNNISKPLEPDYDVASKGGEHAEDALHSGTWDWHSYMLNGAKNEKFKERCPKTARVVDDVSNICNSFIIKNVDISSFSCFFLYYSIVSSFTSVGEGRNAVWYPL